MRLGIGVEFDGAYRSVGTIATKPGIGAVFSYDKEWVEGASELRPKSAKDPVS